MNPSTALARDVVTRLLAAGVREVVLSPGSRNASLAFAAYDAAVAGSWRLHTRIDERSAGFLGLGLSRTGAPAAVVCTSGTAAANLLSAVLEAAHAGVPLVVVTADRPARLRGTSANQTTDQVRLYGDAAAFVDLAAGSVWALPSGVVERSGPVHLNVQLDDPLLPDAADQPWRDVPGVPDEGARGRPNSLPFGTNRHQNGPQDCRLAPIGIPPTPIPHGPRTVVVAGDDAGPAARILAERGGWPLLAEPTSGSRTGDHAIRTYRLLLDTDLGAEIERIVVAGHPTLSRPVSRLLARDGVEIWAAPSRGRWPRRPHRVDVDFMDATPEREDGTDWLERWRAADATLGGRLDGLLRDEGRLTPYDVAGAVARALPAGGLLVVGASNPIRDLDLMVPRYDVGTRRKTIANRGLAGIDGTVSTAIGAALGRSGVGRSGSSRALALLGDVTFLHDTNGLVLGPDEPRPDLTVVVANDDGGSIFANLEQGAPSYADRFERLFGTPHGVDLASLCAATRTPHWRVESRAELEHALASPNGGIEVVEALVDRAGRRDLDARIRALATQAQPAG